MMGLVLEQSINFQFPKGLRQHFWANIQQGFS